MTRKIPWEASIAYLAGILDGEGTIGAYFYADQQSPKYGIWIVNTDQRIILRVSEIMKELGAEKIFVGEKNYKKPAFVKSAKRSWYVQVNRKKDIQTILVAVIPYLVSKQEQAQLIVNFFKEYPNLLYGRGNKSGKQNDNFPAYEKLVQSLKEAKTKIGAPVETK